MKVKGGKNINFKKIDFLKIGFNPQHYIFVGPPGSGKTITIPKVAVNYFGIDKGYSFYSTDFDRYRGMYYLKRLATMMGVKFSAIMKKGELNKLLSSKEISFIDTASFHEKDHYNVRYFKSFFKKIIKSAMFVICIEASRKLDLIEDILKKYQTIKNKCVVLTNVDEVNSIKEIDDLLKKMDIEVLALGNGPCIPYDLIKVSQLPLPQF